MKPSLRLAAIATSLLATPLSAQQFDVQTFHPGPSQTTSYFGVNSAEILAAGQWELGLVLHYADNLLVVSERGSGDRVADIVSNQLVANVLVSVGIADRLELGVDLPVIMLQGGEAVPEIAGADGSQGGAGIGSVRIVPALNLFDANRRNGGGGGAALSVIGDLLLPTGRQDDWQGEDFRAEPELVFDYAFASGTRFSLAAGMMFRSPSRLVNLQTEDMFTYGVGVDAPLGDAADFHLIVEADGGVTVRGRDLGDVEELPLEGRIGGRYFTDSGVVVSAGLGLGILDGAGVPDWRILAGVAYSSRENDDRDGDGIPNDEDGCPDDPEDFDDFRDEDGCSDPDNDRDGIRDVRDACPNDPEDRDEFDDDDGCPEPDNDQDGLLDPADSCPNEPEDFDGFQDRDGCPDPDNDADGILDVDDDCPNDPEDFDGFEDEDGCADPDNDRDGRPDLVDACPNDAEDFDGFEDDDGCPEAGAGLVNLTCEAIEILDRVHFDTDSDVIQQRSYGLLDQVAQVMTSADYIHRVQVEGHTDDRGADDYNLDLSQRRAASVRQYLMNRGVEGTRLVSVGVGEAIPIADNATADGRAENRRVEFRILEQDSSCTD